MVNPKMEVIGDPAKKVGFGGLRYTVNPEFRITAGASTPKGFRV